MFVGADGVQTETCVGCGVDRQAIVVTHQQRLTVTGHQQLDREGAVEGPQRVVILHRHVRMETGVDAAGGAGRGRDVGGLVVQPAGAELANRVIVQLPAVAQTEVEPRTGLHGFEFDLREELVPALMRPAFSRWPAFGGRAHRITIEEVFDLRLPGVAIEHVGIL
ncbi:hypothetical protein D9M71_561920 [compost metagenome]